MSETLFAPLGSTAIESRIGSGIDVHRDAGIVPVRGPCCRSIEVALVHAFVHRADALAAFSIRARASARQLYASAAVAIAACAGGTVRPAVTRDLSIDARGEHAEPCRP